jgi:phage terminase small subunit
MPRKKVARSKDELLPRELAFCLAYISNGFNAFQAVKIAGYSEKSATSTSSEILKRPRIQKKIKDLLTAGLAEKGISPQRVIEELAALAFSDIKKTAEFDGSKVAFRSFDEMGDATRSIQAVETEPWGKGGKKQRVKFKFHDKRGALELLGRHMLLFGDRADPTSGGAASIGVNVGVVVLPANGFEPTIRQVKNEA